jgi:hypothetical protein
MVHSDPPSRPLLCSARQTSTHSLPLRFCRPGVGSVQTSRSPLPGQPVVGFLRHCEAPRRICLQVSGLGAQPRGGLVSVSPSCPWLQLSPWVLLGRCSVVRSRPGPHGSRGQGRDGAPDNCCRQPPPPARLPACRPQRLVQWATPFLATRWRAAAMWGASKQSQRASSGGGGCPPTACARCKRTGPSSRCGLPGLGLACLPACLLRPEPDLAGGWIAS